MLVGAAVARADVRLATTADATDSEPALVWRAPAGCPDADAVRARIEHRLGGALELRGIEVVVTKQVTRRGKVERTEREAGGERGANERGDRGARSANERGGGRSTFVASIDTRAVTVANGVRTLTSSSGCDALADAVAVVVARLASEWRRIDAEARAAAAARTANAARVAARMVETDARLDDTSGTGKLPADRTWGLGVHAMVLSGIGTVPRVGVGGELSVFARREDYFAELGFARWATQSAYLVAGAPGRVEVGLDVVTARLGWSPREMPIRAWLGGEVGAMRGQGAALANTMRGTAPWVAVTGGFGVGWPMARYARLIGTFEVSVPTSRVDFALAQGGEIYSSSPAAARCALGLELGLP